MGYSNSPHDDATRSSAEAQRRCNAMLSSASTGRDAERGFRGTKCSVKYGTTDPNGTFIKQNLKITHLFFHTQSFHDPHSLTIFSKNIILPKSSNPFTQS
ncbi:hypothetical protein HAX54_049408 [Datura stramonium]|uniref:Uncharacterized protein n=1 Tax=Datura stramonium TaxID=4076 RepID=A0ABS8WPB4_DATST|nr:hypothetical protein [Datura stramonium]